jgi:Ca2+-binding RTX toxin-like protein
MQRGGAPGNLRPNDLSLSLIDGTSSDDILTGTSSDERINGRSGNDTIFGDAGNDKIEGGAGFDTLNGGDGDDLISGGQDKDFLTGGLGADTFILSSRDGNINPDLADVITDYQDGVDRLRLKDRLTFANLQIIQGTNQYGADTFIQNNGQILAILQGVNSSTIDASDFARF